MPGNFRGRDVTIQDIFEAVGRYAAGEMSEQGVRELERVACPGEGACGGIVSIDAESRRIHVDVPDTEVERRRQLWSAPEPRYTWRALAKYARLVGSASEGAVCG